MWTARSEELTNARGLRFQVDFDSRPATFAEVMSGWQDDAGFRKIFNSMMANVPFTAFRWETPAVATSSVKQPFEFVLLNCPDIARRPDPRAFEEHFLASESDVVVFSNLGGDAIMIVPRPIADSLAYGHLAAFVRYAPENQQHALWQQVGRVLARRVGTKPVWLSTAGAGVSWLHVRLDDRPKYYGFGPYKQVIAQNQGVIG